MFYILHSIYKRINQLGPIVFNKLSNFNFSKPVLNIEQANAHITSLLESNNPFVVTRFGAVELSCVMNYLSIINAKESLLHKRRLQIKQGKEGYWKGWSEVVKIEMARNAGFFPVSEETLAEFSRFMISQMRHIDVLGVWNLYGEDYLQRKHFTHATLVPLPGIEPYYHVNPWSRRLKGKKVLVIHPFEKSIVKNYKKRENLFDGEILPQFELKTLKAVQSVAGSKTRFVCWFDAYKHMCDAINQIDFDVAIIGAGAYGFPLATFIKQMGRQAIHMGGATQILFGIKGARWDNIDFFKKLYNKDWTRPLPEEVPSGFESVEGGCYW